MSRDAGAQGDYRMMKELGGMEIPLNPPRGRQQNKRLRNRDGVKAADFPDAFIVDEPLREIKVSTRRFIGRFLNAATKQRADGEPEKLVTCDTRSNYPHNGVGGLAIDPAHPGWLAFGFGENLGADYTFVGSDGVRLSGGAEGGSTLGMPYCHLLPFTESHQWEKHTAHFDFRSADWKEWCDYVARSHCAELSDDPNLIGYFYSDCPCWIHDRPANTWRGPMFDPERLKTKAGRKELTELANLYYRTTHDAIRRYDKHHLLLGDRYEANAPTAMEVINAAKPYVDVLSFQDFRNPVKNLDEWHRKTGKPVLLADAARIRWLTKPGEFTRNNGAWYAKTLEELFKNPGCIGFHLCGAYQRNRARRYGLLDEQEKPDVENVTLIKSANEIISQRMQRQF